MTTAELVRLAASCQNLATTDECCRAFVARLLGVLEQRGDIATVRSLAHYLHLPHLYPTTQPPEPTK